MDDELLELEEELRRLRPAALRAEVTSHIEAQLTRRRSVTASVLWLSLPIAAAVALALSLVPQRDPPASGTDLRTAAPPAESTLDAAILKPVSAENLLLARSEEESLVTLADGTPARRIREAYLDTIVWRNPATNASLRWTVPREQVRLVPVFFQ